MTTRAQDANRERVAHTTTTRRHRRSIALAAVTLGAIVATVAVVDTDSSADDGADDIAFFGSTWS